MKNKKRGILASERFHPFRRVYGGKICTVWILDRFENHVFGPKARFSKISAGYCVRLPVMFQKLPGLCFFFQNESEFRRQLRIVRSQQMGFLSAASMESGSYQRGYEHIVRYSYSNDYVESIEERRKGLNIEFYSRISVALPFLSFP